MRQPGRDRVEAATAALNRHLAEEYPEAEGFDLSPLRIDIEGWVFFRVQETHTRDEPHFYAVIREDPLGVVDKPLGELERLFRKLQIADRPTEIKPAKLAEAVLCFLVEFRHVVIKDQEWVDDLLDRIETGGAALTPPSLQYRPEGDVRLTFWSQGAGRRLEIAEHIVDVTRDYRVSVRSTAVEARFR